MFGKGISTEGDILDLATAINVVQKSGAWFAYNGEKIGQGRENAKIFLSGHPDIMQEIESQVRAHYFSDDTLEESVSDEDNDEKTKAKSAKKKEEA